MKHTLNIDAANDTTFKHTERCRTVPIPETITPVPGYPSKLVVYKVAASKFWQTRCWIDGTTHKRTTKSQSLRIALNFARRFYEELLVSNQLATAAASQTQNDASKVLPQLTFAAIAAQLVANERARVERHEFAERSLQVMQNRLDTHILPRWAKLHPSQITYAELRDFTQDLSVDHSSTSVSQYLVIVRKVLTQAMQLSIIDALPAFPKVKVVTTPRGAFTPTEYWQLLRTARRLRSVAHPSTRNLRTKHFRLRSADYTMPPDVAWAIGFMVNSFIRPSDLKTLKHKHVEVVRNANVYLRLSLPETKKHNKPIVTLQAAVRIYQQIVRHQSVRQLAKPDDYLFLPHLRDRTYAQFVLAYFFRWILDETDLRVGPHGQNRTLYSLRHSAITFRLLYGQGIDLLTLARNSRTSIEVINNHYASTVSGEQNIALLQSRRTRR